MLSAEGQEFGGRKKRGERHCIQGPVGKRKEEGGAVQKIFKKIFWRSGKDSYLCSPASGKREREKRPEAQGRRGMR